LAIKAGRFDTEKEYDETELRASKKRVFSQAFTPRNKVKFAMEGATAGVQAVDLEASAGIRSLLEEVFTCVQLLSTRLPELQ
jgi:hypothetical protein